MAVIGTLAAIEGVDPTEVDCLFETIDPESLDTLIASSPADTAIEVEFQINGYRVQVRGNGAITVTSQTD